MVVTAEPPGGESPAAAVCVLLVIVVAGNVPSDNIATGTSSALWLQSAAAGMRKLASFDEVADGMSGRPDQRTPIPTRSSANGSATS
jgi:hypothetical protein